MRRVGTEYYWVWHGVLFPQTTALVHVGADTESVCCLQLTGDGAGAPYAEERWEGGRERSYSSLYGVKLTVNQSQQ